MAPKHFSFDFGIFLLSFFGSLTVTSAAVLQQFPERKPGNLRMAAGKKTNASSKMYFFTVLEIAVAPAIPVGH